MVSYKLSTATPIAGSDSSHSSQLKEPPFLVHSVGVYLGYYTWIVIRGECRKKLFSAVLKSDISLP